MAFNDFRYLSDRGSKPSLLSCSTKVLSLIAEQASLQDSEFHESAEERKRLHLALDGIVAPTVRVDPYHIIEKNSWKGYDKTTLALASTCRLLREVSLPFLFKILPLSKTTTGLFHVFIKEQHGKSFDTVLFDVPDRGESFQATEELFLHTVKRLPNIQNLIFTSHSCFGLWLEWTENPSEYSRTPTLRAVAHQAASETAEQIKSLSMTQFESSDEIISTLPNLRNFELLFTRGSANDEDSDLCGEALATCSKLESISIELTSLQNLRGIPLRWQALTWKSSNTLTTLQLTLLSLQHGWEWILKFATRLETLDLTFNRWEDSKCESVTDFPNLKVLKLWCPVKEMTAILNSLSASKLANLSLRMRRPHDETLPQLFSALEAFKGTLTFFQFSYRIGEQVDPLKLLVQFRAFVRQLLPGCDVSLGSFKSSAWYQCSQESYETIKEENVRNLKEARALLEYTRSILEQTERSGDDAGVAEWMRWMAPLAARRTLEEQ